MKERSDYEPQAPDGMTTKKVQRLRTLYKKAKPDAIERIITALDDPDTRISDLKNYFDVMDKLEALLKITSNIPTDLPPEAESDLKSTISKLKGKLEDN